MESYGLESLACDPCPGTTGNLGSLAVSDVFAHSEVFSGGLEVALLCVSPMGLSVFLTLEAGVLLSVRWLFLARYLVLFRFPLAISKHRAIQTK